jgi:hypothetical protein
MTRLVAGFTLIVSLVVTAPVLAQSAPPCNPYLLTCLVWGPPGPSINPYTQTPNGLYAGMGPYAPPTARLESATMQWALNGDLFLDAGDNRFGWLIVESLSSDPQDAIIEYTSEAWAAPAYRVVSLGPKARVAVGLHGDALLAGAYFSAHLYFEKSGTAHATFRPHATDTQGQHDVPGVLVPRDAGTH